MDEQNKLGGHDSTDQKTVRDWADEYGVDYDEFPCDSDGAGILKGTPRNPVVRAYYEKRKAEGKTSQQALICISRRLISIL